MKDSTSVQSSMLGGEFLLRLLSAIILLVVALAALWWGSYPYMALLALGSAILCYEGYGMLRAMALGSAARVLWLVVGALVLILAVGGLWLVRSELGFVGALWLFAMVWATDIGAYFAGRGFGGRLLAPKISPKKTWSGLLGGMVAALIVGATLGDRALIVGVPLWIGLAIGLLAQMGDLLESWMKRKAAWKDSGRLIPGHGGLFDRVDGLIPVAILLGALVATGQLTRLAPPILQG